MTVKASIQICCCFVLMYSFVVKANPSIAEIQGITEQNAIITIKGEGFSTPIMPVTQLWDAVENIESYSVLSVGDEVPGSTSHPWSITNNAWGQPFYFEDSADSADSKCSKGSKGSKGSELHYCGEGRKNLLSWPNINREKTPNRIYVSWKYKPSMHPNEQDGANKFIRIWDAEDGMGTRISWTQKLLYCGLNNVESYEQIWKGWTGNVGEWNRHEIYLDFDRGDAITWINNMEQINLLNCKKSDNKIPLNVGLIGFDHGTEELYSDMRTELDEIYISGTLARVEVANTSTLEPSTIRQIQPISAWSDKEVKFNLHLGELSANHPIYIYVFNEDGVANKNGFLFCPQCPNPPLIIK